MKNIITIFFFLLLVSGCAINPVTGNRELALVGTDQEISLGAQQYEPGRQMQGGDYLVEPELSSYVGNVGNKLASVSDRPLPYEFNILNNSTPNAWALPGGKIVVNRGLLLELHSEAELAAVLSHEIVHAAARHGAQSMERGMLLQGALLATSVAASNSDYAGLAVGGAQLAAGLISQRYSREAELEADYYGMQYMVRAGYDPQSAVDLQQTFVRLSEGGQKNWLSGLFASHPPSQERVDTNRQTALLLGARGFVGEEIYQQKISRLKKNAPAYTAYDQAVSALNKADLKTASTLVEKALRIEPSEALFHGLKGDISYKQQKYQQALSNYNQAIALNDHFFNFYLQRGLTKEKLGDNLGAQHDLKLSNNLLPTATANKKLGDFSLAMGNRSEAKNYFQNAASSNTSDGKQAMMEFARLDVQDNPARYIQTAWELSPAGSLIVKVANTSPLPLHQVRLQLSYLDASGNKHQTPVTVPSVLRPGSPVAMNLDSRTLTAQPKRILAVNVLDAKLLQ